MPTTTSRKIRALREVLGRTQAEFAAVIGASKDAVASWETGRNELSGALARRIALATGVDERSLLRAKGPLLTLGLPRRPYTREEFEAHQRAFWGGGGEGTVKRHAERCADALELLFRAAARSAGGSRLGGVLGSFIQWCEEAAENFELEEGIAAQLDQRTHTLKLTKSYGQWREMMKQDPEMARKMGFKNDPKAGDGEALTLSLEVAPMWLPGRDMGKS